MGRSTRIIGIVIFTLSVVWLAGCDSFGPPSNQGDGGAVPGQESGIQVTGIGTVTVTPDTAVLRLGVESTEISIADAFAAANTAMADIMTVIIGMGVEGKDIQTGTFNIDQLTRRDSFNEALTITGYRVTNTATVKIRMSPIDSMTLDYKVSNIIAAAVEAGGDLIRINQLSFTVDEPSEYYDEARKLAAADAAARAKKLADEFDVRLGDPVYLSESVSTPLSSTVLSVPAAESPVSMPPINIGETDIVIYLQVTYTIE